MKMAKETWIQGQCQEVEECLRKSNSKKAYQLVKDLTTEKQGKSTTIQDKSGKCPQLLTLPGLGEKIRLDNPVSELTCLPIYHKEFSPLLITSTCNNR